MNKLQKPLALLALGAASIAMIACSGVSASEEDRDGNDAGTTPPAATQPIVIPNDGREGPSIGQPAPGINDQDTDRVEEVAPIEDFEVISRDSMPPTYVLHITSGLPGGCAAFERIDMARDGNTIEVTVINTMPAPDALVACTMIYGLMEQEVELEDIEPGVEYTVIVNGEAITFTAE